MFSSQDGLSLQLVFNDQEYILSCPVDPQFQFILDPVSPAPTTHPLPLPQPPTEEQIPQLPHYFFDPYSGLYYTQLPQVYPPGPQPAQPPKPTQGGPPGPQPQQLQTLYPTGLDKLPESPGEPPSPPYQPPVVEQATYAPTLSPAQISQSHQLPLLPLGPTEYSSGLYYPHMPFYYPAVTPAPTSAATKTTTTSTFPPSTHPPGPPENPYYPYYYYQIPYYPAPTAAPPTLPLTSPSPPPPTSPPKHPVDPQPPFPHPYYPYYYSFFPPFYHPLYHPFLPQYPEIQTPTTMTKPPPTTTTITITTATTPTPTTTSATSSTTTQPAIQTPHLQCLMGRMVVFLPFAHQDSIQVKGQFVWNQESFLFMGSLDRHVFFYKRESCWGILFVVCSLSLTKTQNRFYSPTPSA